MKRDCQTNGVIGCIIRNYRLASNLSQQEVAEAIGKSVWSYRNYESGKTELNMRTMLLLAEKYGCSIDSFFPEGGKKNV